MAKAKSKSLLASASGSKEATKQVSELEEGTVMYIGHIPHGFYERQIRDYFKQFGAVKKVRVSRSKKTGNSRGYAFVQFKHAEVCQIAADAMDGYMMFKQKLVCRVVPAAHLHATLFQHANRPWMRVNWQAIAAKKLNAVRDPFARVARNTAAQRRDQKRRAAISAAGIDYEYPELQGQLPEEYKKYMVKKKSGKGKSGAGGGEGLKARAVGLIEGVGEEAGQKVEKNVKRRSKRGGEELDVGTVLGRLREGGGAGAQGKRKKRKDK